MKACPYCAEQIQDAAIKCRFCNTMLDGSAPPPKGGALAHTPHPGAIQPAITIYEGYSSWKAWFWRYVLAAVLTVGLGVLVLNLIRKNRRYKITERTIDYEVGTFSRRIETLQLWRVQDIDFRQSFFERLLGIATIHVFTKDLTDPELVIRGLPASREIFDRLKEAADLARQQRVVGIVE